MLLFSIYAMIFDLQMDLFAGDLIYLIYMCCCSTMFGCVCGFLAVMSSGLFVSEIYSRIKSD